MTITLRPEHEKVVTQAIQSGAYQSPEAVIERALRMLRSENTWLVDHKDEIAEKIDRAFGQFERGEFFFGRGIAVRYGEAQGGMAG